MNRSPLPVLGIVVGALLVVGSLLALTSAAGTPAGANMAVPAAQAPTLTGTLWEWENTETSDGTVITATDPSRYTIEFLTDGTAGIKADCNSVSATYVTTDTQLSITLGASTRVACPPDTQDTVFLRDLGRVSGYLFIQGKLILQLPFDSGSMTFREAQLATQATPTAATQGTPAPAATPGATGSLTGGVWQWMRTERSIGPRTDVPNPANYTIEFMADGTAGIRADCNTGTASYVLTGTNGIDIGLGIMTLVACPPLSLDDQFRQQLDSATTYEVGDDTLVLGLSEQGSSMVFARVATVQPTVAPPPAETPQVQPTVAPIATPQVQPTVAPEVPGMPRTGAKD